MQPETIYIVKGEVGPDSPHPQGTPEWQFSDGPAGNRGASSDYVSLAEGLKEHSGSILIWDDSNDDDFTK